ncbi:nuclear transport factor 2 family protein [Pseudaminobacter soli (ex Li et al. 2025)]|nr:nuclear transport factor 2 family protein [Mesorhizobium soli]
MQNTSPQAVLQAYIDGSRDLDRAKLAGCFHPSAIMTGFLLDNAIVGTPELYLADIDRMVSRGVSNEGYEAHVEDLTVQGSVASATVVMSGLAGLNFNDFMHLVEEEGRWSIISKLFTTV